jgi:large subunit ribosomal protein L15
MDLSDVRRIRVPRKARKRVGRGPGSGWGVTSGRGNKGQGSRTGTKSRLRFEGGQMPLYRRLPKKGFGNSRFRVEYHVVNVGDLERAFPAGAVVDMEALKAAGLAPKKAKYLKILGFGEAKKALSIRAHGASAGAKQKVESSGGTLELLPVRVEYRPKGAKKGAPEGGAAPAEGGRT